MSLATTTTIDQRIIRTPDISGGQPRIAGHRITVKQIVIWHDLMGKSPDEIATEYDLTLSDVYAALYYYHENSEEIHEAIQREKELVAAEKAKTPSKLDAKLNAF
jgi:uncharacterized protein (DUF433 family)